MEPFVSPKMSTLVFITIKGGVVIKAAKHNTDRKVIKVMVALSPNFADKAVYKKLPQKLPI